MAIYATWVWDDGYDRSNRSPKNRFAELRNRAANRDSTVGTDVTPGFSSKLD